MEISSIGKQNEQQKNERNINIYPNTIKFRLVKNWMLSTILVASVIFHSSHPTSASTNDTIDINYGVIPKTIEKGKSLLLSVTVTNTGKSMIENFNIDIVSSGFRLLDVKGVSCKNISQFHYSQTICIGSNRHGKA